MKWGYDPPSCHVLQQRDYPTLVSRPLRAVHWDGEIYLDAHGLKVRVSGVVTLIHHKI